METKVDIIELHKNYSKPYLEIWNNIPPKNVNDLKEALKNCNKSKFKIRFSSNYIEDLYTYSTSKTLYVSSNNIKNFTANHHYWKKFSIQHILEKNFNELKFYVSGLDLFFYNFYTYRDYLVLCSIPEEQIIKNSFEKAPLDTIIKLKEFGCNNDNIPTIIRWIGF